MDFDKVKRKKEVTTKTPFFTHKTFRGLMQLTELREVDNHINLDAEETPEVDLSHTPLLVMVAWGDIGGDIKNQPDLYGQLILKADLIEGIVPITQLPPFSPPHEHPYILLSEKGSTDGVATLDDNGFLSQSQLPAIAISNVYTANNVNEMLGLTTETGDIVIRTDLNKSFVRNDMNTHTVSDYTELLTPTDAVLSVNGKTGAVTIDIPDISGKIDKVQDATEGNLPVFDDKGGITDNNVDISDYAKKTDIPTIDISGKIDKVQDATEGNLPVFDDKGGITDNNVDISDYAKKTDIPTIDISGKIDKVVSADENNIPIFEEGGSLKDSEKSLSDYAEKNDIPDISNKADKVEDANTGNFPTLTSSGNIDNSDYGPDSFATPDDIPDISDKVDKVQDATEGNLPVFDADGGIKKTTVKPGDFAGATAVSNHTGDTNNPHQVTKSQLSLGNVDNTSDNNKPVSTATATAIDEMLSKAFFMGR